MTSFLDLANEARNEYGYTSLSLTGIQLNRGDSVETVQAVNRTYADFLEYSVDFDFNEVVVDVTLTIGSQIVAQPITQSQWDVNVINWVKYIKGDGTLPDLIRVDGVERAKELEAALTTNSLPLFFYVNQSVLKVIPAPDQAYDLKIGFQGRYERITNSNISTTLPFPPHFNNAFVHGIKARWRRALGDDDADKLEAQFYKKLDLAANRNKFGQKKSGYKLFRMAPSADRSY